MLKYLFTATYKNGTVYQQTLEDISKTDPKRSCFFDVKIDELASFVLKGNGHEYGVDLRDGHFEIDGVQFFMHEDPVKILPNKKTFLMPLTNFQLIFFRRHTHTFQVAVRENNQKEIGHEIVYRLGWQCTVAGQNYQQIMQFK